MTTYILAGVGLLRAPRASAPANRVLRTHPAQVLSLNFHLMGRADFAGIVKGRIDGTVKEHSAPSDLPLARMTYLHRQRDGRRVGASLSDPNTGAYTFINIDPAEKYFVLAFDHTLNYNAVVKSDVTPDIMT